MWAIRLSIVGAADAVVAVLLAEGADPLSGGAGWLGAGLLGLVLAWLMLKYIPDKDKQLKDILMSAADEREHDRDTRHAIANNHQLALTEIMRQHENDAKEDRLAFEHRNQVVASEIRIQTAELKVAIAQGCKFMGECENYKPLHGKLSEGQT